MRDVITMLGEARLRGKSGSSTGSGSAKSAAATATVAVVDKDKPVFNTTPDSDYP
uniref:Uncharacterized protein n=1 Tax=Oryza brachyantha TaxID=4533 RepID=J3MKJ2_ORYBR